jgi:hypothetical protein
VRCERFGAAARRGEGEYASDGSLTDEQRGGSVKDPQPLGLWSAKPLAALLLSHRALSAMLLRRALPKIWQTTVHSFPIYEMGSSL